MPCLHICTFLPQLLASLRSLESDMEQRQLAPVQEAHAILQQFGIGTRLAAETAEEVCKGEEDVRSPGEVSCFCTGSRQHLVTLVGSITPSS